MYRLIDVRNCSPKDVTVYARVYKIARETGKVLVKVEYFLENPLSPMKFS